MEEIIKRKIIHIKARPTYENINYVTKLLKLNGYKEPKYINDDILKKLSEPPQQLLKKQETKIMYTFEEIDYLPNLLEEKEEENNKDDDSLTNSDAEEIEENEIDAEENEIEKVEDEIEVEVEGEIDDYDEYYEEDDESEFSE